MDVGNSESKLWLVHAGCDESRVKSDLRKDFFNPSRWTSPSSRKNSINRLSSGSRSDVVGGSDLGSGGFKDLPGVPLKMLSALMTGSLSTRLFLSKSSRLRAETLRGILAWTMEVVLLQFDILEDLPQPTFTIHGTDFPNPVLIHSPAFYYIIDPVRCLQTTSVKLKLVLIIFPCTFGMHFWTL